MPTTNNTASGPRTPESILREKLIDVAREGWKNRLIDLSRRNNLLFYKPTISGTLELPITPLMMAFLSDGETRPISDLLTSDQEKITSVRAIARKGLENLEEKGLSTLYLALGRCTWTADDGGRDPIAPIFLVPIGLKLKGQDLPATEVQLAGDVEVNPVLLHVFNRELNLPLTTETLLSLFTTTDGTEAETMEDADSETSQASLSLDTVLDFLNATASRLPGFRAERFAVIGNFSFQKLAMVKDLENRRQELLANDVVAAIAGDDAARRKLGNSQIETDPKCLDAILPDNEFSVVEADSSQQCAIAGISSGQSAVVHGPPGTGKSQTITNLITTLAAQGKKILFVAEKRAALEVVMNRLEKVGLDHLVIDLHGAEQTPKKVMERVARTLSTVREAGKPISAVVHEQFVDRRTRLNQHAARMHTIHQPTEQTVYAMQGALLRLPSSVSSILRWRGPDLMQINPNRAEHILDLLTEAAGFETLFNRTDPSPWTGVELKDGQAVQNAVDLAGRLSHEIIPRLMEHLDRVSDASQLRHPKTMVEINELLIVLKDANHILSRYSPEVFTDLQGLIAAQAPGQVGGIQGIWLRLTNDNYRAAFKAALLLSA